MMMSCCCEHWRLRMKPERPSSRWKMECMLTLLRDLYPRNVLPMKSRETTLKVAQLIIHLRAREPMAMVMEKDRAKARTWIVEIPPLSKMGHRRALPPARKWHRAEKFWICNNLAILLITPSRLKTKTWLSKMLLFLSSNENERPLRNVVERRFSWEKNKNIHVKNNND